MPTDEAVIVLHFYATALMRQMHSEHGMNLLRESETWVNVYVRVCVRPCV